MNNKSLKKLKENYNNIEVPDNLESMINNTLNKKKYINKKSLVSAASLAILVGSINIIPAFANSLESIPVIGNLVKVVRFSNYSLNENGFDISIDTAKIDGLNNKKLEEEINKELESDSKKLYNEYINELKELEKENIPGRELVKSWTETKTNNDSILSLVVYNHHAQGSSNTTRKFYNINKKNETALTLDSMFAGVDYVNIISENIKSQMEEQMKNDPDKSYWINIENQEVDFTKVIENQGFYINDKNELVICFDKYEAGPGYMGLVEFVIPKDVLNPNLG